jgi:hypothetical protein
MKGKDHFGTGRAAFIDMITAGCPIREPIARIGKSRRWLRGCWPRMALSPA